jgi:threonine/homoserine/homoserine lactone efflux protein
MSYANLGLSIIGMLVAAGFTQFIINSAMTMRVLRLVGVRQEILPRHAFRLAFTNAITNPKPLPFFGTVLPLFLPHRESSLGAMSMLVLTFMSISFISLNVYGSKRRLAQVARNRPTGMALRAPD